MLELEVLTPRLVWSYYYRGCQQWGVTTGQILRCARHLQTHLMILTSPGQVRQSSSISLWRRDQRFLPDHDISLQNYLFLSIHVFF